MTITVCSKVLRRASPVFKAMLGRCFAEGKALRDPAPTTHGIPTINLPEDDPEAMVQLCRALHLTMDINENAVTFEQCIKLASLCDEYDMAVALGSWSEVWMKPWKDNYGFKVWIFPSIIPPVCPLF